MPRTVHLDVNESGAWRRVSSFDLDDFQAGELEHASDQLLRLSSTERITARISIPGDTRPLAYWSRADGWREVNKAAEGKAS